MSDIHTRRMRHAASHFLGAVDWMSPASILAAATPQHKHGTSSSADLTLGTVGNGILPWRFRHEVTAPVGNTIDVTTTYSFANAADETASTTVPAGQTRTFQANWQAIVQAAYGIVAQDGRHIIPSVAANDDGAILETVRFQAVGSNPTVSIEWLYVQM